MGTEESGVGSKLRMHLPAKRLHKTTHEQQEYSTTQTAQIKKVACLLP